MANHPADAIIWGRCARCDFSEEDHERWNDGEQEVFLCPTAFPHKKSDPWEIDWSQEYDEIKAGDEIG